MPKQTPPTTPEPPTFLALKRLFLERGDAALAIIAELDGLLDQMAAQITALDTTSGTPESYDRLGSIIVTHDCGDKLQEIARVCGRVKRKKRW